MPYSIQSDSLSIFTTIFSYDNEFLQIPILYILKYLYLNKDRIILIVAVQTYFIKIRTNIFECKIFRIFLKININSYNFYTNNSFEFQFGPSTFF